MHPNDVDNPIREADKDIMNFGNEHENDARIAYINHHIPKGFKILRPKLGIVKRKVKYQKWFGFGGGIVDDIIVNKETKETIVVEYKCLVNGTRPNKEQMLKRYNDQIQFYLYMLNLQKAHLIMWNPFIPHSCQMAEIDFDPQWAIKVNLQFDPTDWK